MEITKQEYKSHEYIKKSAGQFRKDFSSFIEMKKSYGKK